jgi:hypothetical protein
MPSAGFDPAIPAMVRQQTYALDRMNTGMGYISLHHLKLVSVINSKNIYPPTFFSAVQQLLKIQFLFCMLHATFYVW